MMGRRDVGLGDVAGKLLLNSIRSCGAIGNKPKSMADAKDVSINSHCGFMPNDGLHDVGRLTPYARKLDEFLQRLRYFAAETFHQHASHTHKMISFAIGVGNAFYIRENVFRCG